MRYAAVAWLVYGSLACLMAPRAGADDRQAVAAPRRDAAALARLIDREIEGRLAAEKIAPSPPADDAEFLRRLYLDLHGVIPSRDSVVAFLESDEPDKRAKRIDQLLDSPQFAQHLADIWDSYLLPENQNNRLSPELFTQWLAAAFHTKTWDRLVYDLLTATGDMRENGAVLYMLKGREPTNPAELANLTGRYFLGVQLACAQCHDHPFTSYTQDDFWGVAGFFTQVEMPGRGRVRTYSTIVDNLDGSYHLANYEDRGQLLPPQVLGGAAPRVERSAVYRQALAEWVTSRENPYFARAMANRVWWHLFGRGIVHPVDDMHPDNPASHPELLESLASDFASSGFDMRHLYRAICNSRTYQRTSRPMEGNEPDEERLFGRMAVKVLSPEQVYDSLCAIFGAPMRGQSGATGRGRMDPRTEFVEFFARDADASPTSYENGIPQLLRMMNSPQFLARPGSGSPSGPFADRQARFGRGFDSRPAESVEQLYLQILSRRPTAEETAFCQEHLAQGGELREILWALVNSSEFCLNH